MNLFNRKVLILIKLVKIICIGFFMNLADANQLKAEYPIITDSRIRTLVYNENEVFRLVINVGYQMSIEFAEDELVDLISVGNDYAWQITPIDRRLFIKPLESNITTNMTVITNKRTYQFEVQSKQMIKSVDSELAYVVRFFYPNKDFDKLKPVIESSKNDDFSINVKAYNFNFSVSGAKSIEPVLVFDDGVNTFFKFSNSLNIIPEFYAIDESSEQVPLKPKRRGKYIVVNTVTPYILLSLNDDQLMVFNERIESK